MKIMVSLKNKFNNNHLNRLKKKIKKDNLFLDTAENYNNFDLIKS